MVCCSAGGEMMRKQGLFLIFLGCAVAGFAQKPLTIPSPPAEHPATPPNGSLTFDVMVTDKAGHPVHGLQQGDFTLLDDKHPAPIQNFAAHEVADSENQETVIFVLDDVNANFNTISLERTQVENYLRSDNGRLAFPVGILLL